MAEINSISTWIISIIVAVLFGVLVEVVMPEGKLSKLIKSVLAVLSILIIISPLKHFDISNINLSNLFSGISVDEEFVKDREKEKIENIENQIERSLKLNGYDNIIIKIEGSYTSNELKIKEIYVDLENLVISDESLNINKYNNIMGVIKSIVDIEEKCVIFYE